MTSSKMKFVEVAVELTEYRLATSSTADSKRELGAFTLGFAWRKVEVLWATFWRTSVLFWRRVRISAMELLDLRLVLQLCFTMPF